MTRAIATVLAIGTLLALPAAAHAAQRYASPTSNKVSGPCPQNDPCHVEHAIEGAVNGDEVIVLPGNHSVSSNIVANKQLNIHGQAGQPRPRIIGTASLNHNLLQVLHPSGKTVVSHLQLQHPKDWIAFHVSAATVEAWDMVILNTGATGVAVQTETPDVLLRDSLIRATNSLATGIRANSDLQLRNVTVMATNTDSTAIHSNKNCPGTCVGYPPITLTAVNVIARGHKFDLSAMTNSTDAPSFINVRHSNYRPAKTFTSAGGAVNDQGGNQSAEPLLFTSFPFATFRQRAGSPTIDAGTADPLNGPTDFDGQPRTLGAAPDIGADEFVPGASDDPGDPGSGVPPDPAIQDPTAPVAGNLDAKPDKFRARGKGASIVAKRPVGSRVAYALSEVAQMVFTIEKAASGRKVDSQCVKPNRSNRKRRRCTRWVAVKGSFQHQGAAGPNSFRFSGRLDNKRLKAGRYRLTGTPIDPAGNVGNPARTKFQIVK